MTHSRQSSMSTPSSCNLIAPLGQPRAIRSRATSSGRSPARSMVAISSSSNTKNCGADATHLPALTHSSVSRITSYFTESKS
jgi:hypothetical protein